MNSLIDSLPDRRNWKGQDEGAAIPHLSVILREILEHPQKIGAAAVPLKSAHLVGRLIDADAARDRIECDKEEIEIAI